MVLSGADRIPRDVPTHRRGRFAYWLGTRDKSGAYLDGSKTYRLNVLLPVPGKLFWSITVYDPETRSEIKTKQGNAALRSLVELKGTTGSSVDLYFGPKAAEGSGGPLDPDAAGQRLVHLFPDLRARQGRIRRELEAGRFREG